jgi:hypothetical protein
VINDEEEEESENEALIQLERNEPLEIDNKQTYLF